MIQVIVLAGGLGEKLWPLSRQRMPKQFLKLIDNEKSLFQITINRFIELKKQINEEELNLIIVCNENNKYLVKQQTDEIIKSDIDSYTIIAEPINKKTTTAIAVALEFTKYNDNILVIPSDQVWDDFEFCQCVKSLVSLKNNGISLIGIKPYYPATRFGYINSKDNKLISFKEKPDIESALEYINNKDPIYLWNTGVLYFKKKVMIDDLTNKYNKLLLDVKNIVNNSESINNIITLNQEDYESIEEISIDNSVLENYENGYVLEYKNYWNDIDNFKSLFDYLPKDKDFNLIQSLNDNVLTINTSNSFIHSAHKLVTTIGISDLVIIDTRDSLLVAEKNSSLNVNEMVNLLKSRSRSEHVVNPVCYKPWGWYIDLEGSDYSGHKVKKICVYPNQRLSLQSHKDRSEHWTIVKGKAKVQIGEDTHNLETNKSIYIPKGVLHRIENIGEENIEFIEIQIGAYLGEDDIIRYHDDFGRKISKNNLSSLVTEDF